MGESIHVTQVQSTSNSKLWRLNNQTKGHSSNDSSALEKMVGYIMPDAQYDSSARDSPPQCHPGTRIQILGDVQARIHDPNLATRMVRIYGPAGVGKSAIMQTLAEAEAKRGTVFTTLFFSRPNERNDPRKAFTTLAYGLAVRKPEYRRYIEEQLTLDPTFLAKRMDDQFQHLFITPFTENRINIDSQRWIVFLDGLDECDGEAEQRRIVDLIRSSLLHGAMSTPFIWIIASRPEAHLKTQFARLKADVVGLWELEVPIDSDASQRDVERYLHVEFSKMHKNNPDSVPPLWPSETDFSIVSKASSGLFVFASTLVAYLLAGDPVSRFKHAISLIKVAANRTTDPKRNPFLMLDLIYTQIMSHIPEEVLSTTKLLLGFYLLRFEPPTSMGWWSLIQVSSILGLGQHETYAALSKLYSVLDCPTPRRADNEPVKFLHASFSDFLLDYSRSQNYFIDLPTETNRVWHRCTEILRQYAIYQSTPPFSLSFHALS